MKSEANYNQGDTIIFSNRRQTATFSGTVDYSYGDELEGCIRVRQIFTETSDIGNCIYVPVGQVL